MVWWDREDMERRMQEGMRSNAEMAHEADEAIMRLLASGEHDKATDALRKVIEAHRAESADPLAVLETLAQTEAVSKWRSLHEQLVELAEVLHTGLPGHTLGEGSIRAEWSGEDSDFSVEGGFVSRFRREDAISDDDPTGAPSDVVSYLRDCSSGVLDWLIDLQRGCGQQAPLVKHDRFVRLCHQATGSQPPQHALALHPTADAADVHDSTDNPTAVQDPPSAQSWQQRAQHAAARFLQRRPRLSLVVVLAVVAPTTVWSSWQLLSDVNRYVSAFVAIAMALAAAAVVGERAGALHGEGSVLEGLRSCSFPVAFPLLRFQGS